MILCTRNRYPNNEMDRYKATEYSILGASVVNINTINGLGNCRNRKKLTW